jgi:tRNA wybutosine-synthesizing protein 1
MSCRPTPISRPLITEKRRESLKNMYTLVGTHSAVKLCRWQKSMMRGQGGCYKWTMYGIRSHQCMEASPNIACANKCLFCWRLNTNPTMKEWKWDLDDPAKLVSDLIDQHRLLIKGSSGMSGVTPEGLEEALKPKHCALSLVGEPIAYPKINEFVHELHKHGLSSFLVNNGQFPEAIDKLAPVTQLYLSVDSPTRAKMELLDRPIFPDFWERFNSSVKALSRKSGRKVFRLTMIEDFNMFDDDLDHYRRLFEEGAPHFVELKALTPAFSGEKKSFLRITNVPSWERLVEYGHKLCAVVGGGNQYEVSCAHEHSKCLLLAHKQFKIPPTEAAPKGGWNTWIDFDKFLAASLDDKRRAANDISHTEYMLPSPSWALYGSDEVGFDPKQVRRISAKRKKYLEQEAAANTKEAAKP